jgi:hypothetical protein
LSERPLHAIFDLGWYAPTFDIFEFALNARSWAQRHQIERVKLVILKRRFAGALVRQPQLPHEYDFRLHDILLGASSLLPVDGVELTSDVAATAAAADPDRVFPPDWRRDLAPEHLARHRYYLEKFMRDQLAAGEPIPGIRIPPAAFKKIAALLGALPRPWISITVRETAYHGLRNSGFAAWQAVRQHFEQRGASVIFVPDVESLRGVSQATPLAAMAMANLTYRAALYDACDLNLAVVNGSIAPCLFNPSAVYVISKFGTEGSNASRARMMDVWGMGPGSEMFYRVPWQRALWESDDDPGRCIAEAEQMLSLTAKLREAIRDQPLACDPWGKPDGTLRGVWDGRHPGVSATQLEEAFPKSPYSCKPWMAQAEKLLELGRFTDALDCAKRAIRLDGRYARSYEIAARCLEATGQQKSAQRFLATAQSLPQKK